MNQTSAQDFDFDFAIIGSGFGGSVSALRLAQKGYRVAVLERGRRYRITGEDFPKTNWDIRRYLWAPLVRCFGIQVISLFNNVMILGGSGVGGGSLVYANTLLKPGDEFFNAPQWKDLADWKSELAPHYETAKKMMGVAVNPKLTQVDMHLRECARALGREGTFQPSEVAVYFGESGVSAKDPYFGGEGPDRTGCNFCGGCMVGCRFDAKNTLDKNYLYLAERAGARVFAETTVTAVRPLTEPGQPQGYLVSTRQTTGWGPFAAKRSFRAKKVIFAAGVLGTLRLLFHCREVAKTLPWISRRLGEQIRTNSEALLGSSCKKTPEEPFSLGIAISSIFHADEHTHIEPVRYSPGSSFMRLLAVPMIDGDHPILRPLKLLFAMIANPFRVLRLFFAPRWAERTVIFLVMQTLDSTMRFRWGRSLLTFFRRGLVAADNPDGTSRKVPVYNPLGHRVARDFAARTDGIPQNAVNEVVLGIPSTAHILGGCAIGQDADHGVIDVNHEVFGYPGLYVCDGSAIPANLGVNPSLTILAMTERAISKIPVLEKPSRMD